MVKRVAVLTKPQLLEPKIDQTKQVKYVEYDKGNNPSQATLGKTQRSALTGQSSVPKRK
jgi:hypothetical protein